MPFIKAEPVAAPFKATYYGESGSGKTFTALLMAEGLAAWRKKRIAYVDTEASTRMYRQRIPERSVHPDGWDFDVLETRSIATVTSELRSLDPATYGVVVIDSVTHIYQASLDAHRSKLNGRDFELRDWGPAKRPYQALIDWLVMECTMDVLILGRQKNVFSSDDSGRMQSSGVAMAADVQTQYEPDYCFHMQSAGRRGGKTVVTMFVEKDRSGIIAGRTYPNPSFETIAPILPYIGSQPRALLESEEDRVAADGEIQDQEKERAARKAEKSSELFSKLRADIDASTTLDALAAAADEVKRQRRYMSEEHKAALRLVYETVRGRLVDMTSPKSL